MSAPTKETLHLVFTRDEGCCARCGAPITGARGRDWSLHHRRPRGSGGTSLAWVNLPGNLVMLCGSGVTACHGDVESYRMAAMSAGFLVSMNGWAVSSQVRIDHAIHGFVFLLDDGTVSDAPEPSFLREQRG